MELEHIQYPTITVSRGERFSQASEVDLERVVELAVETQKAGTWRDKRLARKDDFEDMLFLLEADPEKIRERQQIFHYFLENEALRRTVVALERIDPYEIGVERNDWKIELYRTIETCRSHSQRLAIMLMYMQDVPPALQQTRDALTRAKDNYSGALEEDILKTQEPHKFALRCSAREYVEVRSVSFLDKFDGSWKTSEDRWNNSHGTLSDLLSKNDIKKIGKSVSALDDVASLSIEGVEGSPDVSVQISYGHESRRGQRFREFLERIRLKKKRKDSFEMCLGEESHKKASELVGRQRLSFDKQVYSPRFTRYRQPIARFEEFTKQLIFYASFAELTKQLQEKGYPTCTPTIRNMDGRIMNITEGYHPLLATQRDKKNVVPNDFCSCPSSNGLLHLITGPNNNGKTCYMNMLAMLQVMAQAGLDIPAQHATISPKRNIRLHYIQPGDIIAGESRYAHELTRMKDLIRGSSKDDLILVDEPCSGTSAGDGEFQAGIFLEALHRLGATALYTTHYHGLAETAKRLEHARNLQCVMNGTDEQPEFTYRIEPGVAGTSMGKYLAKRLGVTREELFAMIDGRGAA
ncbi:MAG: hypothetical protein KJ574_03575 [Nanoarchaeota archaeon]|nr:hypothetical protein [Nanoarchaeota archaeon]